MASTSNSKRTPARRKQARKTKANSKARSNPNRYQCTELLGQGAFANVWLATDHSDGSTVAVKLISDPKHTAAGRYEHYIASSLNHPNIVKSLNCMNTGRDQLIIVQEFIEGGELFERIQNDYGVAELDGKAWLEDMVSALEHLHRRGIVHRDIKPENVLLTSDGVAKLADFGMAEFDGQFVKVGPGTVPYMPPEAFSVKGGYNVATSYDIWSLGVVLYILLTGDFPWLKATPDDPEFAAFLDGSYVDNYPWDTFSPRMRDLLSRMLAINPEDRCTAADVREYLNDEWFMPADEVAAAVISASSTLRTVAGPVAGVALSPPPKASISRYASDSGLSSGDDIDLSTVPATKKLCHSLSS